MLVAHPVLREFYRHEKAVATYNAWSMFEQLAYRQDVIEKSESYFVARKDHENMEKSDKPKRQNENGHTPMQLHYVLECNAVSRLKEVASPYHAITFPSMIDGQPALHATAVEDFIFSCDMQQHTADNVGNEGLAIIADSELVQVASQPKMRRRLQNGLAPVLVEDVQAKEVPPIMCAKMLSKSIGRAKTISTFINKTGPRLEHDSFAVSVHDVLASGPNELTIDLKPD